MKELPILFTDGMVMAILEDRKTQTRRIALLRPVEGTLDGYSKDALASVIRHHAKYQVGDKLWVKTNFYKGKDSMGDEIIFDKFTRTIRWKKENIVDTLNCEPELLNTKRFKFISKLFMPKWAARIWLEVTEVRVQRVQDISLQDIEAEGVEFVARDGARGLREDFTALWDSINAKRGFGWDVNPYVWAISFKRI